MAHTNLGSAGAAYNRPVRVVIFASEQTMPPMQFLLHVLDRYRERLRFVGIYHTDDVMRSQKPAQRLSRLIKSRSNGLGLKCHVETKAGTMEPESVRRAMAPWFDAAPEDHWLVNVTGGTKPMSSAATELTLRRGLPHGRVLYLEMTGVWFELFASGVDGLLDARALSPDTDLDVPQRDALDRLLPIKDLVETQYPLEIKATSNSLEPMDLLKVTREVIDNGWIWKPVIDAAIGPCSNAGDAFEKYVGAGLKQCGLHGLAHSVDVLQDRRSLAEMDLVCCHQGRIVCMDIKLPDADEDARGVQLAKVATDARQIGGTAALAIAIRPGWEGQAPLDVQAAALRVKVVTQEHAESLFTRILQLIDPALKPTNDVLAVEALLASTKLELGISVLSDLRNQFFQADDRALQLDLIARKSASYGRRPWALIALGGGVHRLQVDTQSVHWGGRFDRARFVDELCRVFKVQLSAHQARLVHSHLDYVVLETFPWAQLSAKRITEMAEQACGVQF